MCVMAHVVVVHEYGLNPCVSVHVCIDVKQVGIDKQKLQKIIKVGINIVLQKIINRD